MLYRPAIDPATNKRVAIDPRTGALAPNPYIGLFVPGSGSYAPGMVVGGVGNTPGSLYTTPLSFGPRFGFAYDPAGNGKTAIRGGFGMFYDRVQGNVFSNTVGQPPTVLSPTVYFGNVGTFLQATGAVGPPNVTVVQTGQQPLPSVMNFSLGVQREVGFHTVVDVSYVGSLARNIVYEQNINPIPMFAHFDPKNIDSTTGSPLSDNYLRPYLGMGNIIMQGFGATSNYHALQVAVNRRHVAWHPVRRGLHLLEGAGRREHGRHRGQRILPHAPAQLRPAQLRRPPHVDRQLLLGFAGPRQKAQ